MGKSVLKCLSAVSGFLMAVDRLIRAFKLYRAAAEERILFKINEIFLDSRSARHDLKYRTRLVCLGNAFVPPLALTRLAGLLILFIALEQIYLCLQQRIGYLIRLIEIEARAGSHSVYSSRLCIHKDSARTVRDLELRHHFLQMLFKIVLYLGIYCKVDIIAVLSSIGLGVFVGKLITV